MCTPSLARLRDDWFLPTLVDDFEVHIEEVDAPSAPHEYGTQFFRELLLKKVECMLRAIELNRGQIFLFSDIDIQFFAKIEDPLLRALQGYDIAFQQDDPEGMICTGFYVCKANERVLKLWTEVRNQLSSRTHECGDQKIVNELLLGDSLVSANVRSRFAKSRNEAAIPRKKSDAKFLKLESSMSHLQNKLGISWRYLPSTFMSGGTFTGRQWNPEEPLDVPPDLQIHHANWTIGVENKLAQMKHVDDSYQARILPEWVPLDSILPKEGPHESSGTPFAYRWCCGPVAKLKVAAYRQGAHRLVIECQNIQFPKMQLVVSVGISKPIFFEVGIKAREEYDVLQATVSLEPGVHEVKLQFSQFRETDATDPRPLALILKDVRLWDCAR
jgi:hypothetical protein